VASAVGIEPVGESDQVVLVGATAVVEDDQPLGRAISGTFVEVQRLRGGR
jgi:hypothetical protein